MTNRYQKLLGNTLIFAIGSFSSKALVFLLMPLYTLVLTDAQYGTADIITTTSNLLTPFVMLSVNEAIVRFGMDRAADKKQVLSIGLTTVMSGFAVFCVFCPALLSVGMIAPHTLLIYLYVLLAALKSVVAQFVRSSGMVRLFAFDGFLSTLTTIVFNVAFLVGFKWGVTGYVLSIILSNLLSVLFLFVTARLHRYVTFTGIDSALRREMLHYAIPLIPTTMFWWITSACDRYIVTHYWGEAANGLYSAAHKLPALLTLVSAIFYQAWQISAVSEAGQGKQTDDFYNAIYGYYISLLFLAASGVIMICRPFTAVWLNQPFFESWKYVPFLTMAEVLSTMVTFLGTFYMVQKRNATVPLAIAVGAVVNLALNLLWIPKYGALGAALATVVCYLVAVVVRGFDIRRMVNLNLRPVVCAVSLFFLMAQTVMLFEQQGGPFFVTQLFFFSMMVLLHLRSVLRMSRALIEKGKSLKK